MTATAVVTPRPSLIDRLLSWWLATPPAPTNADPKAAPRANINEDLRTALEMASTCQVSALSAEYAHHLIDRHCARIGERG